MLVIIILLVLIFALTYPYTSAVVLKLRMLSRLVAEAKAAGFRVRRRSRWIALGKNGSSRCDLIVSGSQRIYAVKLWSAYHKGRVLIADEEQGLAWERSIIKTPLYVDPKRTACRRDGKAFAVPEMLLPAKLSKDMRLVRVMLVYPSYREVRKKIGEKEYRVYSKDTVFGRVLCSPSAFFAMMRAEGVRVDSQNEDKENQSKEKIVNSDNENAPKKEDYV